MRVEQVLHRQIQLQVRARLQCQTKPKDYNQNQCVRSSRVSDCSTRIQEMQIRIWALKQEAWVRTVSSALVSAEADVEEPSASGLSAGSNRASACNHETATSTEAVRANESRQANKRTQLRRHADAGKETADDNTQAGGTAASIGSPITHLFALLLAVAHARQHARVAAVPRHRVCSTMTQGTEQESERAPRMIRLSTQGIGQSGGES